MSSTDTPAMRVNLNGRDLELAEGDVKGAAFNAAKSPKFSREAVEVGLYRVVSAVARGLYGRGQLFWNYDLFGETHSPTVNEDSYRLTYVVPTPGRFGRFDVPVSVSAVVECEGIVYPVEFEFRCPLEDVQGETTRYTNEVVGRISGECLRRLGPGRLVHVKELNFRWIRDVRSGRVGRIKGH